MIFFFQVLVLTLESGKNLQGGIRLTCKSIDNDILGMVFGSLNVLSGRNGAGKSTILNQIYIGEAIRQKHKVFLFSGELVAGNVKEWLIRTLANEETSAKYMKTGDDKFDFSGGEFFTCGFGKEILTPDDVKDKNINLEVSP